MDPNLSEYALKKQNSLWDAILQRASGGLLGGPQTSGVQGAQSALQSRAYQMHVKEAQALGQQPMTPQEFQLTQQPQVSPLLGR